MKQFYFLSIILLLANCSDLTPKILQEDSKSEISQIDFKFESRLESFALTISNSGSATYNAKKTNGPEGFFKSTISKEQFDSLKLLIQNANFFALKNDYFADLTDQPVYTLTIKQENGLTKKIEDDGPSGPEELKKLYDYIMSLRYNEDWK